jgi:AraC family transcriptional regulator
MASRGTPREEYVARVNLVIDYIEANVDRSLTVAELAAVAAFSPFHFHRIFGALVGEPLGAFVDRVRVEKAAALLLSDRRASVTDVALRCGYGSSAAFARAFRQAFGMTATEWRHGGHAGYLAAREERKNGQAGSKVGEEAQGSALYHATVAGEGATRLHRERMEGRWAMFDESSVQTRIEDAQPLNVAYVRHIGPYKGDGELFGRLFGQLSRWAGPRGLLAGPSVRMLSIYHDNPELTPADRLRVSAGLVVPEGTPVEGEVGSMVIDGGRYAVSRFTLNQDEYQAAWDYVFGKWLPESGHQPDDGPCFELYLSQAEPDGKHSMEIWLPVKPA